MTVQVSLGLPCKEGLDGVWQTLRTWSLQGPPSNPRQAFGVLATELETITASWSDHAADNVALHRRQVDSDRQLRELQEKVASLQSQNSVLQAQQGVQARDEATLFAKLVVSGILRRIATQDEIVQLRAEVTTVQDALAASHGQVAELAQLRVEHAALCAQLRETVPPVSVMCRMRPLESYPSQSADAASRKSVLSVDVNEITMEECGGRQRKFRVDRVFGCAASEAEVLGASAPYVDSILSGESSCIFAYGATGSGKTYTFQGDGSAVQGGLAHNAIRRLIDAPGGAGVRISMIEVYCDQFRDLLATPVDSNGPPVLQCSRRESSGRMVLDCVEEVAEQFSKADRILQRGYSARATESTGCNERSSRSHIVLIVQRPDASGGSEGKLVLVDLAGSENVKRSGADGGGKLLEEAKAINKSLSALADVVEAIAKRQMHIPYRNSKLTMLLEDAFTNAKVLMLLHVSQLAIDSSNTASSLQFGGRVRSVDFGAQLLRKDQEERLKSAHRRSTEENQKLQLQVDQLKSQVADSQKHAQECKQQVSQMSEQLREKQKEEHRSKVEATEGRTSVKTRGQQDGSEPRPATSRVHSPLPPDYGHIPLQRSVSAGSLGAQFGGPRRSIGRAFGAQGGRDADLSASASGTSESNMREFAGSSCAVALESVATGADMVGRAPLAGCLGMDARGALCDVTNNKSLVVGEVVEKEEDRTKIAMSPRRGSPTKLLNAESPSWCRALQSPLRSCSTQSFSPRPRRLSMGMMDQVSRRSSIDYTAQRRLSTSAEPRLVSSEPQMLSVRPVIHNGVFIKPALKAKSVDYAARARRRRERCIGALSPSKRTAETDELERRVGFSDEKPTPCSPPQWYYDFIKDSPMENRQRSRIESSVSTQVVDSKKQLLAPTITRMRTPTPRRRPEDMGRWR